MSRRKEQDEMVGVLRSRGYQVSRDGQGHWCVTDALGRYLARFPATTANRRWRDNLKTKIRRNERLYAQQESEKEKVPA